jgi:signal transduction histidine kinase
MITAYASLEVAISATKRGAYDFLAKPFTPEELKGAVRTAAKHIILQRQARKLAEEKRQVRFQFISVLAHELKAPLSAIEGYMHMLLEGAVKEDAMKRRLLERCVARTDGMRKMIMDLLDLTRIESGQKARQLAAVDVAHVARTAVETALPAAKERGITVALHADAPVSMLADAGEIEIILNNLISNAVKYNIEGGKVDVTLAKAEGVVTLTVADTGIGMKPEDAKKLFGEFVRIKNAKTKDILGSGLGLSIVKKLAQLYEGDARVESAPGAGSTFTVTLKDTEQAIG